MAKTIEQQVEALRRERDLYEKALLKVARVEHCPARADAMRALRVGRKMRG